MDIRDFAQEFLDNVRETADLEGIDYEEELARSILEYIEDNGEVNAPELCSYKKHALGSLPMTSMMKQSHSTFFT